MKSIMVLPFTSGLSNTLFAIEIKILVDKKILSISFKLKYSKD